MTHVNFTATQNSISNSTIYDENTGGTTSTPQNLSLIHILKGDKKGLSSLRINDQYRLEFKEITNAGNQTIIEVCSLIAITNHYK